MTSICDEGATVPIRGSLEETKLNVLTALTLRVESGQDRAERAATLETQLMGPLDIVKM